MGIRSIIFRGKRFDNGEWVIGYLWRGADHTYITPYNLGVDYNKETNRITAFAYEVDPETVGQYTGLTDKNGKKIFEGDIIKVYHNHELLNVSYVIFEYGEYVCKLISGGFIDDCETLAEQKFECEVEVVGNIYNNPELLEVEE